MCAWIVKKEQSERKRKINVQRLLFIANILWLEYSDSECEWVIDAKRDEDERGQGQKILIIFN